MIEKVWAVTMVKDEEDVIEQALLHLVSEGVDGIIVSDNLSTDRTPEILQSVKERVLREFNIPIIVQEDREVGYYQAEKMNKMAAFAASEYGASWIIPFDADELWCGVRSRFCEYLKSPFVAGVRVVGVPTFTYLDSSLDDGSELNPFKRITVRRPNAAAQVKVAYRWNMGFEIGMGNHQVLMGGTVVPPDTVVDRARIAHFPYRSWTHFIQKVRNGVAAYNASNLSKNFGIHWRGYGNLLNRYGEEVLKHYYFASNGKLFVMEPWRDGYVIESAGWCRWA